MQLLFRRNSFENDLSSITNILKLNGTEHDRVKKYLCDSFHIDLGTVKNKNYPELEEYITPFLRAEYENCESVVLQKIELLQKEWNLIQHIVLSVFEKIFERNYFQEEIFQVNLSVNYVCPYNLEQRNFDINYRKTVDEVLESCIHELIHFYWFHKWEELFESKYNEYQNLVWQFSEIAVDAIFKETELKGYLSSENPAHKYLYEIEVNNQKLTDIIRRMFRENDIDGFMKKGIEFFISNRNSI